MDEITSERNDGNELLRRITRVPMPSAACLDEMDIASYIDDRGDAESRARIELHLGGCRVCIQAVAEVRRALAGNAARVRAFQSRQWWLRVGGRVAIAAGLTIASTAGFALGAGTMSSGVRALSLARPLPDLALHLPPADRSLP
jgi:hypothetical protein